jgi:hypothetical protein
MTMSNFCKRHYEAIATAIQEARFHALTKQGDDPFTAQNALDAVIAELAGMFARDNGLFKRDRFIRACQPGANVRKRT